MIYVPQSLLLIRNQVNIPVGSREQVVYTEANEEIYERSAQLWSQLYKEDKDNEEDEMDEGDEGDEGDEEEEGQEGEVDATGIQRLSCTPHSSFPFVLLYFFPCFFLQAYLFATKI
jgi:hypothetical protein